MASSFLRKIWARSVREYGLDSVFLFLVAGTSLPRMMFSASFISEVSAVVSSGTSGECSVAVPIGCLYFSFMFPTNLYENVPAIRMPFLNCSLFPLLHLATVPSELIDMMRTKLQVPVMPPSGHETFRASCCRYSVGSEGSKHSQHTDYP